MDALRNQLKKYGRVKVGEQMNKHTTFKIGGPAEYFISVSDNRLLVGLLDYLSGQGIRYFLLGGGSNVIFPDHIYEGVVINITTDKLAVDGVHISAESGVLLSALVSAASGNRLSGLEWAVGIPGTVGGAVRGNAGAMGDDIASVVRKIKLWRDGEVLVLSKDECGFAYRSSAVKTGGGVILEAEFMLEQSDAASIMKKIQDYFLHRQTKYPSYPSAGSFFKNIRIENWPGNAADLPPIFRERGTVPVGWMTEQLGLKGLRIGGAALSEEHGNFIVNMGGAKSSDVLKIVEELSEKVYNKYGVKLEPEVEIIQ